MRVLNICTVLRGLPVLLITAVAIVLYFKCRCSHKSKTVMLLAPIVKRPEYNITVKYRGQLGNHMFEYASLLAIAKMNNKTVLVPEQSQLFQIFNSISSPKTNIGLAHRSSHYIQLENKRAKYFDEKMTKLKPNANYHFVSYLQSYKYFEDIKSQIRREFTFRPHIASFANSFVAKVLQKQKCIDNTTEVNKCVLVGVHVRRGDMLTQHMLNFGHGRHVPVSYFNKAIAFYEQTFSDKKVVFIISSDDIPWCKTHFKVGSFVFSENHTAAQDLAILSKCNHSIMTIGTFGWWAAWLTGGITVYYNDWAKRGSLFDKMSSKEDFFYPGWIPM